MNVMHPIIAGDWRDVPSSDAGALVGKFQEAWFQSLEPGTHAASVNIQPKVVRAMPLPCYARTLLCEVETVRDPDALSIAAFLYGPFGIRLVDGFSAMVHTLNESVGVLLETAEQAAAYGRFFCSAVHGSEGRFEVIEVPEQLGDLRLAEDTQERIGPMKAERDDDRWRLRAMVRYGNALFLAVFSLDRQGLIEMVDDEPLEVLEMEDGLVGERFEAPFRLLAFPSTDENKPA